MKLLTALRNKKGMTLVEIIVVLVIIGILVAATVPNMMGFVNRANERANAAEARVGLVAAQAILSEDTSLTEAQLTLQLNSSNLILNATGTYGSITITGVGTANARVTAITFTPVDSMGGRGAAYTINLSTGS